MTSLVLVREGQTLKTMALKDTELYSCKHCDRQNLQTAHAAQYQKNKQPNQKMGRRPKETFLQRKHTDGQEAHEKLLNITNY